MAYKLFINSISKKCFISNTTSSKTFHKLCSNLRLGGGCGMKPIVRNIHLNCNCKSLITRNYSQLAYEKFCPLKSINEVLSSYNGSDIITHLEEYNKSNDVAFPNKLECGDIGLLKIILHNLNLKPDKIHVKSRKTYLGSKLELDITALNSIYNGTSLTNESIDIFLERLERRNEQQSGLLPKIAAFNSTFSKLLLENCTDMDLLDSLSCSLDDIFSNDILFIPVVYGGGGGSKTSDNFALCVVDLQLKRLLYFNSKRLDIGPHVDGLFDNVRSFLTKKFSSREEKFIDWEQWSQSIPTNIPYQSNSNDSGVFVCRYAEFYSRRCPFNFTKEESKDYRARMVYEFLNLKDLK